MEAITRIRPEGLVRSPAFSHAVVVPPGATTIYIGGQDSVDADGVLVDGVDLGAAYGAVGPKLAAGGEPPLVTAAFVTRLGVPGALVEVSAVAAVICG